MPRMRQPLTSSDVGGVGLGNPELRCQHWKLHGRESRLNFSTVKVFSKPFRQIGGFPSLDCCSMSESTCEPLCLRLRTLSQQATLLSCFDESFCVYRCDA